MNRLTVYRQRLDNATNWAITLTSGMLVLYLSGTVTENIIIIPFSINLFFSFLEARRYRYFYTSSQRVHYLELLILDNKYS